MFLNLSNCIFKDKRADDFTNSKSTFNSEYEVKNRDLNRDRDENEGFNNPGDQSIEVSQLMIDSQGLFNRIDEENRY